VPQQVARSDQCPQQPEQKDTQHSGRPANRSALAEPTAPQRRSGNEADGEDECREAYPGRRHLREQKKTADADAKSQPETSQADTVPALGPGIGVGSDPWGGKWRDIGNPLETIRARSNRIRR
jgi:hypothetical protein